jgi:lipoyl(octanoyl) transferase
MRRLKCNLYNLTASGKFVEYESAWRYQKAIAERANLQYKQQQQSVDSILLVQHPSVYTLGRGATPENIKFKVDENSPHKVVRVERGGEVTWHGPGQLVAYPILNLNNHKRDLHW